MEHEVQVLQRDRRAFVEHQQPQVRVGAYCRVSTELEEQQSSLELQIRTFRDWKCGLQTTVKMRVTCNTYDPVKLAEMTMAEGS